MDQKVIAIAPRLFAKSPLHARAVPRRPVGGWLLPTLQHPALSYSTEEVSIHDSLDLSFRQDVAVSRLDRQLIDDLNRIEQPLPCTERLASGF